tara:strand:+ start:255 stop:806 length:552 start_codon:yes stop_codon:yes gene_type:complete
MKIYTKKGDQGKTGLIGGTRVSKSSLRIECYGTVDELNSYLGILRTIIKSKNSTAEIIDIQDSLFTIGSHLACDPNKKSMKLPEIKSSDINSLENWIDAMDNNLEPLKSFTLPGGSISSAHCHVARCICRRAERLIVDLNENENGVNSLITPYLNRLSDYLFTLSRKLTVDDGAEELKWQPKQ